MQLDDLFIVVGQGKSIQDALDTAAASGKKAVLIPPAYTGSDTYSNSANVPLLDLRIGQTGLSGSLVTPGVQGPAGAAGSISATSGPSPWIDVAAYGAKSRAYPYVGGTATTQASSPNVTLVAAGDFANGDGVVIYKAGAATTQNTPAAPTAAAYGVQGAKTVQYQCVGFDKFGGLTAASSVGSVTNASNVFGNKAVTITSMNRASNIVTVTFASPINATANQHIVITGDTSGLGFNGVWLIATAPTPSQITFNLTGSDGGGAGASTGRLVNCVVITAISRTGSTVTVTTDTNHNFVVGTLARPTVVLIQNVLPAELNGFWVIATASGTTFTFSHPNTGAAIGTVDNTAYAMVYEYNLVTCPALAGTTVGYYIYGDDGTGTVALIGKTLPNQITFMDWGPFLRSGTTLGFVTPSYVPTTPPLSAQNQLFSSKISSGGGSVNLVLADVVPTAVSGATILHDEGYAINAAAQAAKSGAGGILLSPIAGAYLINYPLTIPANVNVEIGAHVIANETIYLSGGNILKASVTGAGMTYPQFGREDYALVEGDANPIISVNAVSCSLIGINFRSHILQNFTDGQYLVVFNGVGALNASYGRVSHCCFSAGNGITTIPLVFQGSVPAIELESLVTNASWPLNPTGTLPTNLAPPIGAIWFKGDDTGVQIQGLGQVILRGMNNINGRGILIDGSISSLSYIGQSWTFSDIWAQQPVTPGLMIFGSPAGSGPNSVLFRNWLGDSSAAPAFGNFGRPQRVYLDGCTVSGTIQLLTGTVVTGLMVSNIHRSTGIGQNTGLIQIDNGQISAPEIDVTSGQYQSALKAATLTANRAPVLPDADGTVVLETSLGIGNGAAGTSVTTTAKGTGTGPTTPQTVVKYAQFTASDGSVYYIPLMQ